MMDRIEEIWDKGNEQISQDKSFSDEFIINSISETSISITSKLSKIIWMGIIASIVAALAFTYNIFFYLNNTTVLILIFTLLVVVFVLFVFLIVQLKMVNQMDAKEFDLHSLLTYKINYFSKQFLFVKYSVALIIVITTFAINLTMENSDGIFEFHKILKLSVFYFFAYFVMIFLFKLTHSVYIKQLRNALFNLEENTLNGFDDELKKHKRMRRLIGFIIVCVFIIGIAFFVIKSGF